VVDLGSAGPLACGSEEQAGGVVLLSTGAGLWLGGSNRYRALGLDLEGIAYVPL
jgi:hypothetical protein